MIETSEGAGAVVVDTSAVAAILLGEPGADELAARLGSARSRIMSAATRVELSMVIEARLGSAGADVTSRFIRDAEIETIDVDTEMADRAVTAWRRFGKGRHRAALNFGDCFVYALAERTGLPIVCVGADFASTDIDVVRTSFDADSAASAE